MPLLPSDIKNFSLLYAKAQRLEEEYQEEVWHDFIADVLAEYCPTENVFVKPTLCPAWETAKDIPGRSYLQYAWLYSWSLPELRHKPYESSGVIRKHSEQFLITQRADNWVGVFVELGIFVEFTFIDGKPVCLTPRAREHANVLAIS